MKLRQTVAVAGVVALAAGAAQADISGNVVRIGVLNDQSGLYADISGQGSVVAARMAAEDFGGSVNGAPIEVVFADHQNRPDIGSAIARQWLDAEGVDVIVDVPTSSVALAIQELTRERGKVFLISGAATSRLTGDACSPTGVHWTYDTYALANGTGRAIVQEGGDTWFFLTADYAFGHSLEQDTAAVVQEMGGEVLGAVRHPLDTPDFSSYLLQAQASGAKIIGLANAGGDTINSIRQASEFGIVDAGQQLAGLLVFISDVHALGLDAAQGLLLTEGFYWNLDEDTREWSQRFFDRHGAMPTMVHAGVYSSVMHYLKAIEEAGTDDGVAVVEQMKEMPVNDFFARDGRVREDGRMVHDMYLLQVKAPGDSEGPWDYYNVLRTIPGDEAYRPLEEGGCPFVE